MFRDPIALRLTIRPRMPGQSPMAWSAALMCRLGFTSGVLPGKRDRLVWRTVKDHPPLSSRHGKPSSDSHAWSARDPGTALDSPAACCQEYGTGWYGAAPKTIHHNAFDMANHRRTHRALGSSKAAHECRTPRTRVPHSTQQAAGLHLPLEETILCNQSTSGLAATTQQSEKTKATKKGGGGLWDAIDATNGYLINSICRNKWSRGIGSRYFCSKN